MKHTPALLTLVAASALAQTAPTPAPAPAKSEWTQTHNLALATDYIFRGVSQIGGDGLALSGGTDVTHASGFSFGLWAANVSFGGSSLELDVYAGYSKTFGDVTASVGLISYHYEGAELYNTTEAYVGLAAYGFSIKYSNSLTDSFGGEGSKSTGYVDLAYSREIPGVKDLVLNLHYGHTDYQGAPVLSTYDSYGDFRIALTYPVLGYVGTLAYSDVDGSTTTQKDALVLSLGKTF